MDSFNYVLGAGVIAFSFFAASLSLFAIAWLEERRRTNARRSLHRADHAVAFVFDNELLVNATEQAHQLLSAAPKGESHWRRLLGLLAPRFSTLSTDISKLVDEGVLRIPSDNGRSVVVAEWHDGLARISITDEVNDEAPSTIDGHAIHAMQAELDSLRDVSKNVPYIIWRQSRTGRINWTNAAYLEASDQIAGGSAVASWPPKSIFDIGPTDNTQNPPTTRRVSLTFPSSQATKWFDIFQSPIGDDILCTAVPADRIVRAEGELHEFVQTLTKTFAHLTTGLAIFDKKRQLALFNPALIDLTHLAPEMLSMRPTLSAFLDKLRENQILPEPKDYKTWRQQMAELEAAAEDGTYEETWELAGGQTYRVIGRPHPDGAVAFMFEDITAEISLTRRFRDEIETAHAVIDELEEAIAVFSPTGELVLANAAYAQLWGTDPMSELEPETILKASRVWQDNCAPTPIWGDVREFVSAFGDRTDWQAEANLADGRKIFCRFEPMPGSSSLVGFSIGRPVQVMERRNSLISAAQ